MPKKRRYLDEVPSGGFLRNYYRARHSDSYDDRARASEKAMLTINGIEPGDIRLPHFPGPIVEWPFGGVL